MASPEDHDITVTHNENSKTSVGATTVSTSPSCHQGSLQRVEGMKQIATFEISHFCVDNLIFDLQ